MKKSKFFDFFIDKSQKKLSLHVYYIIAYEE